MDKYIPLTFDCAFAPEFFYSISDEAFVPCTDSSVITAEAGTDEIGSGAVLLRVKWKNAADRPVACRLEIRTKTGFAYDRFLIPAVSYNGNVWGKGGEPKGLAQDGKPWIFDHRRTSIPSCTISENTQNFFAMFASAETAASLDSCCSMIPCDDGAMIHRIQYPSAEAPVTYAGRDAYAAPRVGHISLQPGEEVETQCYILHGVPGKKSFATTEVENFALDLAPDDFSPAYEPQELKILCCEFVKRLLVDSAGHKLICTGMLPDSNSGFAHRVDFEFGWCGQNGMYAREMSLLGFETGDASLVDTAADILDF